MTNEELIAKIKAKIDKLYGEYKEKFHQIGDQYHLGLIDGLDMAERVLDTLESEKPIDPEAAMKELDEKIALVKQRGTWDGVDVDKYMDEVRGREPEKPTQEGLEAEMDKFFETMPVLEHENIFEDTFKNIARHFYELGCTRTAEKYNEIEYNRQRAAESVPKDLEEAAKDYTDSSEWLIGENLEHIEAAFIAGAKWQAKRMKDEKEKE